MCPDTFGHPDLDPFDFIYLNHILSFPEQWNMMKYLQKLSQCHFNLQRNLINKLFLQVTDFLNLLLKVRIRIRIHASEIRIIWICQPIVIFQHFNFKRFFLKQSRKQAYFWMGQFFMFVKSMSVSNFLYTPKGCDGYNKAAQPRMKGFATN